MVRPIIAIVGLAIAAVFVSAVWGDLAPLPGPGPRPGPRPTPVPAPTLTVRMNKATVAVHIGLAAAATSRPDAPAGRGPTSAPADPLVQADVTCDFELLCTQARNGKESYAVAFPVYGANDPAPKVVRFQVQLGNGPAAGVQTLSGWRPGVPGEQTVYNGFRWPMTATQGARQQVKVNYTLHLPLRDGAAQFRYVLRSGSTWSAPIGRETVTIRGSAVQLSPQAAGELPAPSSKDGVLVWELVNASPTQDIVVRVTPAPAAPKVQAGPVGQNTSAAPR